MRNLLFLLSTLGLLFFHSCQTNQPETTATADQTIIAPAGAGQSGVKDDVSQPNVVNVAMSSKDHTTLVAAIKAAELVDALSNAGPFTVFAPTNAAFDKLPAGTVDGLLKPEKKSDLQDVLQYHVYVGRINADQFVDGQVLNMVNGQNITIHVKDGKVTANGSNIVASVPASNGIIHVIDAVLLPPAK